MKIPLPKNYSYDNDTAFVKDDILYINTITSFRAIMYDLTYSLNECKECFYCHKPLTRNRCTLDHMYPVDFGGPTIPDNLAFSCSTCNSTKSNLTADEFLFYLSLSEEKKEDYMKETLMGRCYIKKWYSPYIPKDWYSMEYTSKICADYLGEINTNAKSYKKAEKNYKKYGHIVSPIIVDRNYVVINGISTLVYALNHSIKKVPTIVLENVEFIPN